MCASKQQWFEAASEDDAQGIVRLLAAGANADAVDSAGSTALHIAAYKGAANVVQALLKANAQPNVKNKQDMTSLMLAASAGHELVMQVLLKDARTDVRITDDAGAGLVHFAASSYNPQIVNLVLSLPSLAGEQLVNAADEQGLTPLMYAAKEGQMLTAAALLDAGADITMTTPTGLSAYLLAHRFGKTHILPFFSKFLPPRLADEPDTPQAPPVPATDDQCADCQEKVLPSFKAAERLIAMLRDFHSAEENRSPEFASSVKVALDEAFHKLAKEDKVAKEDLLNFLPPCFQCVPLPVTDNLDQRTFGVVLTAIATLPGKR